MMHARERIMEQRIGLPTPQAALLAAAKRGDLEAVKAHFQLPDVLENVEAWNSEHRAQRLGDRTYRNLRRRSLLRKPWFDGVDRGKTLFTTHIVYHEQVEVFRWFFAPQQIAMMEDSLRVMGPQIARACLFAQTASCFVMVEILLASRLFTEIMGDRERQSLLGSLLHTAASRGFDEWVQVLIAHGADTNCKYADETPLTAALDDLGNTKTLDSLLAHGSWLEGEESVLEFGVDARNESLVAHLLRRGADANAISGAYVCALHQAAHLMAPKVVGRLVVEAFADVDARDERGRTPLMIVASGGGRGGYRDVKFKTRTIELLLDCGANVRAVDTSQRGVLHYVMCDQDATCVRLFLELGLDPNEQDATGQTPLGALLLHAGHGIQGRVAETLDLMLQAGADPYLLDRQSGLSATQMLETSESGQAFIAARRQFFRQRPTV